MANRKSSGERYDVIWSKASGLSVDARAIATNIERHRNRKTNEAFPSLDLLMAETGLPRKRVVRAIGELEHAQGPVRLKVIRRCRKDGRGRAPNIYVLTIDLSAAAELCSAWSGAKGVRRNRADQSAAPELRTVREQSSDAALRSDAPSADLSAVSAGPEFQNGGDLSAYVDPITLSMNSLQELSPSISSETEPKAVNKRRRKPTGSRRTAETLIADNFAPDLGVFDWASSELGFDRSRVEFELARFETHAKSKERRLRDWAAGFRNWLLNAKAWQKPNGTSRRVDVQNGDPRSPEKREEVREYIAKQQEAAGPKEGIF